MQFIPRCHVIRGAVAVLVLTAGLAAQTPSDDDALHALTQQFFAAYPHRDADALQALWSEKAPDRDKFMRQFRQQLKDGEGFALGPLNVPEVKIEGDKATLRVALTVNANDAQTKRPLFGFGAWQPTLRFVRENGAWRVWQCVVSEQELAAQLAAAATEAAQDTLLAQSPELVTPALRRALEEQGRQLRARNEPAKVVFLSELMARLGLRAGDETWTAHGLNLKGTAYFYVGDYGGAADYFSHSQRLCEKLRDDEGLAQVYLGLGLLRALQDENLQSIEYYQKGVALAETVGDKLLLARLLNNLGTVTEANLVGEQHSTLFNPPVVPPEYRRERLAQSKRVAALYAATGNDLGVAIAEANTCALLAAPDDRAATLACLQAAVARFEAVGATAYVIQVLVNTAQEYYLAGRYTEALTTLERSFALSGNHEADAYTLKGRIYRALGQDEKALADFEQAIAQVEQQRATVSGGVQTRQRFFASRLTPYHEMAALQAASGHGAEALRYAEMVKARILLDVAESGNNDYSYALSPAERAQERTLNEALPARNKELRTVRLTLNATKAQLDEAQARLNQARQEAESWRSKLDEQHPELRLRRGETPAFKLPEAVAWLDTDTAVLEYAVLRERCYLFVLTRQAASGLTVQAYPLALTQKDLAAQAQGFQRQVAGDGRGNYDIGYKKTARALDNLLVQPARAQIGGRRKLVIVPEDVLWELPFQALLGPSGKHLLEEAEISYAPSLSVLRAMMARRDAPNAAVPPDKRRSLLALGNPSFSPETVARVRARIRDAQPALLPDAEEPETAARMRAGMRDAPLASLPEAEKEVAALRQLYGPAQSLVAIQAEARESLFKAEAGRYRVLHLATHGIADNTRPMYSALVLAQAGDAHEDGLLEAWEIAQMRLNADLVVLSACQTARGRIGAGEGMLGLSWAFFLAGAPATVVSQWSVKSSDTMQLMIEFHRQLTGRAPVSKAAAMRRAALKMLRRTETNHPFHWAGFIVVGDGR